MRGLLVNWPPIAGYEGRNEDSVTAFVEASAEAQSAAIWGSSKVLRPLIGFNKTFAKFGKLMLLYSFLKLNNIQQQLSTNWEIFYVDLLKVMSKSVLFKLFFHIFNFIVNYII